MGESHSKTFFGQNTALFLNSSSMTDPFLFIRCFKRKANGQWEKPSNNEGKAIKCSLEEIIMMLQVLNRKLLNWTSFHTYKNNKTPISFGWEDDKTKTLWINIANYSKMLNFSQTEILRLLLEHILKEKIKYATIMNNNRLKKKTEKNTFINEILENGYVDNRISKNSRNIKNEKIIEFKENYDDNSLEEIFNNKSDQTIKEIPKIQFNSKKVREISNINGSIVSETEKALLINFNSEQEFWMPKSTIHCQYTPKKNIEQVFVIDNWILKKNNIIS